MLAEIRNSLHSSIDSDDEINALAERMLKLPKN